MRAKLSSISIDELQDIKEEIQLVIEFIKSNTEKIISVDKEFIGNIEMENPLNNDSEKMLLCISDLITAFKAKSIETEADNSDLGLCLGHSAAAFSAEYLGWDLKFLACDYWPKGEVAVISKDKRYVLYLAIHIFMFLNSDVEDNEFIKRLKSFKAGDFPADAKGKFSVIM